MFTDKFSRRSTMRMALCAACGLSLAISVKAEDFPGSTPIKLVVPFAPGGLTDSLARLLAHGLASELKGTVVVENIPGATGTLGVARVARAAPDGYTLVMGLTATQSIAPALYKDLPYRPQEDFVPLGRAGQSPIVILANPKLAANNVQEMLALARQQHGRLFYAAWGVGSGGHLTMESINQLAKVKLEQVPYKGEAPILQALMGGEVLLGVASVGGALPFIKTGKLKALGVVSPQRSFALPTVPTLVEQGVPFSSTSWYGLFAPAKTPASVTHKLTRALDAVLARPDVIQRMRELGLDTEPTSLAAFARQIKADTAVWEEIVAVSGTKLQ